jgi:hypothetical protein
MWSSAYSTIDTTSTIADSYEFPIAETVYGDEVFITIPGDSKRISLAEVEVFGTLT